MTEAEELELLELEEEEARAAQRTPPASTPTPQRKPSTLESLGRGVRMGGSLGFADEAGAGIQALAQFFTGGQKDSQGRPLPMGEVYRQARDENRTEEDRARTANPWAYGAGEVAGGLVVPIPGSGAKTVAKGGLTALKAAKAGAKIGAAGGLGYSGADLTKGEVGKAAFDTSLGLVIGSAAGAGGHKAGEYVSRKLSERAARKAAEGEVSTTLEQKLREFARERALAALGAQKPEFSDLKALPGGLERYGEAALDVVRPWRSRVGMEKRITKLRDAAGDDIGKVLDDEAVGAAEPLHRHELLWDLRGRLLDPIEGNPAKKDLGRAIGSIMDDIRSGQETYSTRQLEELKRDYARKVKDWARQNDPVREAGTKQLSGGLEDIVEQRVGAAGKPDLLGKYRGAKERFGTQSQLADLVEHGITQEQGNRKISLTDYLVAGGAGPGAAVGLATSSPTMGLLGVAGGALLNKGIRKYGDQSAARSALRASQTLGWVKQQMATKPEALGRFGRALVAFGRDDESMAAAHQLLLSEYPEYRKITEDGATAQAGEQ